MMIEVVVSNISLAYHFIKFSYRRKGLLQIITTNKLVFPSFSRTPPCRHHGDLSTVQFLGHYVALQMWVNSQCKYYI